MSHPQALNKEQMLQLMGEAIPAIARRLEQDEGWAFLMKQANRIKELEAENVRLKAEVERVGAENSHLHKGIYSLSLNVGQLKDEVERLTKAGDAMASGLQGMAGERPKALADEWNDAKGVQS